MKKSVLFLFLLNATFYSILAQNAITLTFTGENQNHYNVPLENVVVEDISQEWQDVCYFPDTIYNMGSVGIDEHTQHQSVKIFQNTPNPFKETTSFALQLDKSQKVKLEIFDFNGKLIAQYQRHLNQGQHLFRATLPSPQTYLLSATTRDGTSHIKMVNTGNGGGNKIEYLGEHKSIEIKHDPKGNSPYQFNLNDSMKYVGYARRNGSLYESAPVFQRQTQNETITFTFVLPLPTATTLDATYITSESAFLYGSFNGNGEEILDKGFKWGTDSSSLDETAHASNYYNGYYAVCFDLQPNTYYYYKAYAISTTGTTYGEIRSFLTSSPITCPDTVIDFDGNTYNTVSIGGQCWMKENLRTTHFADGTSIELGTSSSFTTPLRYYPHGIIDYVETYGYLYNWPAVMHGSSTSSTNPSDVQGICPTGWHMPSSAEWMQLNGYVSNRAEYLCFSNVGSGCGKALASNIGWSNHYEICSVGYSPTNNNATGFSIVPAGYGYGSYDGFGENANLWSATLSSYVNPNGSISYSDPYSYSLHNTSIDGLYENRIYSKYVGLSVRCLHD